MNNILLGLSGGIDSAVSAAILKEQGYNVIGCFLNLTGNSDKISEEEKNARKIAEYLKIDFVTGDFRDRFRENVSSYFIREYLSGKTPNPCIMCNPTVKIRSLADMADSLDIEKIATGHYALTSDSEKYSGRVLTASPSKKDQSYFLCRLAPEQIGRLVFPLGSFISKEDVREYGEKLSLPNRHKPDSQEICFIPDNDYQKYICAHSDFIPAAGNFLDNDGSIIGRHNGIINYTIGQRKGLGAFGEPRYVKEINAKNNTVTLCKKDERFAYSVDASQISWAVKSPPSGTFSANVKIRSTAKATEARVTVKNDILHIEFKEKVLAPCPGQSAAVYDGKTVIGGGIIL
ncbi:MAG: tRNA 2-thiouridine(34) synthase MnmA [Ruminococcaceae bacterium]|nr:tRNA 2-thiouridine(34) synthase MnmA [Oscillospiraceae bacterium]